MDENRDVNLAKRGKFEGGMRGGMRRSPDSPRMCQANCENGGSWGQDSKRDADAARKRRYATQHEGRDAVEGNQFWTQGERREPEIDRKKKFAKERTEGTDRVMPDNFRGQWRDEKFKHANEDDSDDENQSQPFPYKRACRCAPNQTTEELSPWHQNENPRIPKDVEKAIRQIPEARLSCAPAAEPSKFDQPNTFMRKLYEKYPYLYKVLKETPPEELVSKVFKDRFLSTYQVDYLHMGIGKEQYPGGGATKEEVYTGVDGEPEPKTVPGCSYRYSKKGEFGRKKTVYEKKDKEDELVQEEKEEPKVSEYMATISKLGGEIINDQLYTVAQITKNAKNHYNLM